MSRSCIGVAVQIGDANADHAARDIVVGGHTIRASGEFRGARRAEVEENGADAGGRRGGDAFRAFVRGGDKIEITNRRAGHPCEFVNLGGPVRINRVSIGQSIGKAGSRRRAGDRQFKTGDVVIAKWIRDGGADVKRGTSDGRGDETATTC